MAISILTRNLKNIGVEAKIYSDRDKELWDAFVQSSKNGTFLLLRDFMSYHSDRFDDLSLLFNRNDKVIGLLPGNIKEDVFYTHQGLTYGGMITNTETKTLDVLEMFDCMIAFLKERGVQEIIYKVIPHIYHQHPAEEDLYALFLHKAQLVARGISSAIRLSSNDEIEYSKSRISGLKKAEKAGVQVRETTDYTTFWKILSHNLMKRYTSYPVHTLQEISMLSYLFPGKIKLYGAFSSSGEMLGGEVMFISQNVAHAQYTAATEEGKNLGAIDLLIDHVIREAKRARKQYFDYGISTENNGLVLNEGLISQKEGFGARAVVYDIYSLKLS